MRGGSGAGDLLARAGTQTTARRADAAEILFEPCRPTGIGRNP